MCWRRVEVQQHGLALYQNAIALQFAKHASFEKTRARVRLTRLKTSALHGPSSVDRRLRRNLRG